MSIRDIQLQHLSNLVNNAENLMQRKNDLLEKLQAYNEKMQKINSAKEKLTKIQLLCTSGLNSYKDERLQCLKERVEENLGVIFPNDDFKVEFVTSTFRNKEVIDFYAGRKGKLFPIFMQNGRLFRQICSFSISTMIQILAGCEILIMDEAINSGDLESTEVVSNLIRNLIDNGYQIVLIEHKDILYKNLPRVQYNLRRDAASNSIVDITRTDYTE